ncbi:MAG: hypothetical protein ACREP7_20945 [Lysobacter sp.]
MNIRNLGCVLFLGALVGCSQNEAGPSLAPDSSGTSADWGKSPRDNPPAWMTQAPLDAGLACYVDVVEGAVRKDAGWQAGDAAQLRISGWAVDTSSKEPNQSEAVALLFNDQQRYIFTGARSDRPDLRGAPQFAELAPMRGGVTFELALATVAPGKYQLAYVVGDATQAKRCDLGVGNVIEVR